mgnify:CR=1 FL=1
MVYLQSLAQQKVIREKELLGYVNVNVVKKLL